MPVNSGKATRESVQGLINDMNSFSEYVKGELTNMIRETDRLGESWRDPQYQQFSSFMYELTESLNKDLSVFDEAAYALQRKVDLY